MVGWIKIFKHLLLFGFELYPWMNFQPTFALLWIWTDSRITIPAVGKLPSHLYLLLDTRAATVSTLAHTLNWVQTTVGNFPRNGLEEPTTFFKAPWPQGVPSLNIPIKLLGKRHSAKLKPWWSMWVIWGLRLRRAISVAVMLGFRKVFLSPTRLYRELLL